MDKLYLRELGPGLACLAICASSTVSPVSAQFVIEMADENAQPKQETSADNGSKTVPMLRGGTVEQTAPLWIIQHRDAAARRNGITLYRRAPLLAPTGSPLLAPAGRTLKGRLDDQLSLQERIHALQGRIQEMQSQSSMAAPVPMQGIFDNNNFLLPGNNRRERVLPGRVEDAQRLPRPIFVFQHPLIDFLPRDEKVLGVRSPALPRYQADQVSHEIDSEFQRAPTGPVIPVRGASAKNVPSLKEFEVPTSKGNSSASAEIYGILKKPSTNASAEINGQLGRATTGQLPNVDAELRTQQAQAKPLLDKRAKLASSELRSIFRRPPDADMETSATLLNSSDDTAISWDPWYARIAKLSEPRVVEAVENAGGPGGSCTISITVRRNHIISANTISTTNAAFSAAVLRAYKGLSGNAALEFPSGSRRESVTFFVDNNHAAQGNVSSVSTQACTGDRESRSRR